MIFTRWMAQYRTAFGLLFLGASAYLADWDPEYAGLSFPFVVTGEVLRVWATGHLRKGMIATGGPYGFVRHPRFLGSVFIAVGLCAISGSGWIWLLALAYFTVCSIPALKHEEEITRNRFSTKFQAYSTHVPGFYPTLRKYQDLGPGFSKKQILENKEHFAI